MHTFQGSDVVFESLQNAQIWRLAPCLVTLKTVSPRAVIEAPRCGVPRKRTRKVVGAMAFSYVEALIDRVNTCIIEFSAMTDDG